LKLTIYYSANLLLGTPASLVDVVTLNVLGTPWHPLLILTISTMYSVFDVNEVKLNEVSVVCCSTKDVDPLTIYCILVSPIPGVHDTVKSLIHMSVAVMLLISGGSTK